MTDTAEAAADRIGSGLVVHEVRRTPDTVADALDLHLHLTVLSGWVNERKSHVADWLKAKGEARIVEDGAAPTWRLGDGQVILTDPKPKPSIEDRDAFAAWYEQAGGTVTRRRTATVASEAILDLVDVVNSKPLYNLDNYDDSVDYTAECANAADHLARQATVTEDVLLPEDVLDRLLAGDDLPVPDVGARCVIHTPDDADPYVVDTVDGGPVPGVTVRPAGARTIQVKPTPDAKARVRRELDSLIGPPVLEE